MYSLLGLIFPIVLLLWIWNLSSRVKKLEIQLKERPQGGFAPSPSFSGAPVPSGSATEPQTVYVGQGKKDTVVREETPNQFVEWLKNNWLSKLGVLLVLIGIGWFLSYAFVHNWIGPVGRIALGFGVGSVLALLGAWRMGANAVQANILLVLGSATVLMTAYAGRIAYDFFTPELVLGLAFLVSAYITTLSAIYNREKLAVYGVLVALAAPLLTHAPEPSMVGLFVYLAVVSIASIWVSAMKGWGSVTLASIIGVLLYSLPFIFGNAGGIPETEKPMIVMITLLLSLIFLVANVLQILKSGDTDEKSASYIAIANGILIFSVINALVPVELRSLLLSAWVVVFAIGSTVVAARTQSQLFFYIYSLIAILFLGAATAIELNGPVLTIAFSLEAAIIAVLTFLVTKDLRKSAYMSLLMLIPVAVSLPSLTSGSWDTGVMHNDAVVVALMSALLLLLGIFFVRRYQRDVHPEVVRSFYLVHLWAGAFYAFALIWLSSHALFADDFATILSLTVYTLVGVGAYLQGVFSERKTEKYFGATVLVLVIARLLIVDVWQMPLAPRIVVFIVIGVLLVSTAFIGRKREAASAPPQSPPPPQFPPQYPPAPPQYPPAPPQGPTV